MKLSKLFAMTAVAGILAVGTAHANGILGAIPFAGISLSENGSDLSNSTVINALFYLSSGAGVGDYSVVGAGTEFTEGAGLDLTNLSAFTFGNAVYGTFIANGVGNTIVTQSAGFLDVFLRGTFTPAIGGPLSGFDPSDTGFRISFTQSGGVISGSGTFTSPAVPPVPEPATMTLFGTALVGLGLVGRKRFAR